MLAWTEPWQRSSASVDVDRGRYCRRQGGGLPERRGDGVVGLVRGSFVAGRCGVWLCQVVSHRGKGMWGRGDVQWGSGRVWQR